MRMERRSLCIEKVLRLQVKEFWPEIVLGGSYFSRGHLAGILSNNWYEVHDRLGASDHMACYYVGVRGTGRGSVRPSHVEQGRTHVHYELSDEDMWNLSRGLARLSSLLLQGGATEVYPAVSGVPWIETDVEAASGASDRIDLTFTDGLQAAFCDAGEAAGAERLGGGVVLNRDPLPLGKLLPVGRPTDARPVPGCSATAKRDVRLIIDRLIVNMQDAGA